MSGSSNREATVLRRPPADHRPAVAAGGPIDGQDSSAGAEPTGMGGDDFDTAKSAHDIGNNLQVLASALDLIDRELGPSSTAAMRPIVQGARRALSRASQLCWALRQPGGHCSDSKTASLGAVVGELTDLVRLIAGPSIEVQFLCPDEAPSTFCDQRRLEDCVLNLVNNAAQAMPRGGRLTLEVYREISQVHPGGAPAPARAVLCVSDTGCGIAEEALQHVFAPSFTTKPNGTGLGLANVRDFAARAGGSIDLRSEIGVGTEVLLRLPERKGNHHG